GTGAQTQREAVIGLVSHAPRLVASRKGDVMSQMTEKMSESGSGRVLTKERDAGVNNPKKGDRFRCRQCGMEVQVTTDCQCEDPGMVHFQCCGLELQRV